MTKTQVKRLEKKGEFPPDFVDTLIEQAVDLDDWTRIEKIEMNADLRSAVSNDMLFPEDLQERIDRTGIVSQSRSLSQTCLLFISPALIRR